MMDKKVEVLSKDMKVGRISLVECLSGNKQVERYLESYKNGLILPTGQWYAPSAVINGTWYCMVLHGIAWYCIVLHGIAWYCRYCLVLHGIALSYMVLHGITWY